MRENKHVEQKFHFLFETPDKVEISSKQNPANGENCTAASHDRKHTSARPLCGS